MIALENCRILTIEDWRLYDNCKISGFTDTNMDVPASSRGNSISRYVSFLLRRRSFLVPKSRFDRATIGFLETGSDRAMGR